jgi:hypothetical protein
MDGRPYGPGPDDSDSDGDAGGLGRTWGPGWGGRQRARMTPPAHQPASRGEGRESARPPWNPARPFMPLRQCRPSSCQCPLASPTRSLSKTRGLKLKPARGSVTDPGPPGRWSRPIPILPGLGWAATWGRIRDYALSATGSGQPGSGHWHGTGRITAAVTGRYLVTGGNEPHLWPAEEVKKIVYENRGDFR